MSEESEQDQNFIDGWPMNTPLDIRMGLTKEEGINHPLRWGIISASAIASDWIKSLQDVPGASTVAIAASCLLYTSPSPRDLSTSRMPSSA